MRRSWFTAVVFLLTWAALARPASAQASGRRRPALSSVTAGRSASAPFQAGEKLEYQVAWMSLSSAASAVLSIVHEQRFYGDDAWHFQAKADTESALRYLFALDDQFDSYADAATLTTRQYELYLNEQGRRAARRLRLNRGGAGVEAVSAPAGTRDPLSALYELRSIDWQRTPEIHFPIFDGNRFYRMEARLAAPHEAVDVPAGRFDATRIAVQVTPDNRGASPMHFTVWLANNQPRTPVRVDAEVPLGIVKGDLVRIDSPR